ncbi:hypothetical protein RCG24_19985 [Neobacillus sp. OS1-32]|uniref:hypothetical protein n=1 Tax=Neobacillus sp. OS1-32 TaxID=3070682 RepID=UPI0027E084A3|nr:hypothetical protein [Neobacillus sp. OS1-32]WML30137.1 hypothetical protein RCG24_19980 [Neobacillus sp. OS1-32]WML30138.1 hypothetical protein RCG24_19985 [Neobacillus sp. OS1-32]
MKNVLKIFKNLNTLAKTIVLRLRIGSGIKITIFVAIQVVCFFNTYKEGLAK